MSIRNLDALFSPKTIALIGASNEPGSVGAVLARNLFEGGFDGLVLPVNPNQRTIRSTLNFRSIADLPETPDLAVIATPPRTVPGIVGELARRGCRAAIVITAGFGEGERAEGRALRQEMLEAARPHLMRILGPNCLGLMTPHLGINATFAHLAPRPGEIAFLTQSGAVATSVLDWAHGRDIGFSHVVSLGDMADIDFGDLLDFLALDRRTRAIVLYVESITHARKFMSAARMAARAKPVVVVKAGRSEAGAKAALSHTGALAGSDAVYEAAFSRAGMLRVGELGELFEAVAVLARGIRLVSDDLTIITNGGGIGVLAADEAAEQGIALAALDEARLQRLDAVLPAAWSRGNPIDILGDATGARYAAALEALLAGAPQGTLLVLNCPTAIADSRDAAKAVITAAAAHPGLPLLTAWLGDGAAAEARRMFAENGIASFETPEEAVRAHTHLVRYRRNQALLMEAPAACGTGVEPDRQRARAIIARALAEGRALLNEVEAKSLLAAYGIPVVETRIARDPAAAADTARAIEGPVALKILSPDITHKSDVGGVALDLASAEEVEACARRMLQAVQRARPAARITGFTVQPMVRRPGAHELIAGLAEDPLFGPIILFGQGGTAVEVIGDRVIGLPPLNTALARDMIGRTRVSRLLAGYRDRAAADREAIAATLVRLSEIAAENPEVAELDINPLLADAEGVIALDARIVVRQPALPGTRRFAIQPYPRELTHEIETRDGSRYHLRPIRPEDESAVIAMLQRSSREDVRLRFFASISSFDHAFAARLTQIDYDREMAFVAVAPAGSDHAGEICGAARLVADPDNEAGEYAVMVRSDLKGTGLGYRLMKELLAYARSKGLKRVFGDVLKENGRMLDLARELGFTPQASSPEDEVVTLSLDL